MEQVAEAAGPARITVHRRFANRQALLEALAVSAKRQLVDALEEARPQAAPALVALHRVTANVLRVKNTWRFTLRHATAHTPAAAALREEIDTHTVDLMNRAQREGLIASDADLAWTRQVYYALLGEAVDRPGAEQDPAAQDPDAMATLVIDALLHGAGPAAESCGRSLGSVAGRRGRGGGRSWPRRPRRRPGWDRGFDQSVFVDGGEVGERACSAQMVLPVYVCRVPQPWVS
ncbi:TetR/AcrR family transcriptional regulator [Streptomyces sp. SAS_272]|uniref:TetR/AcrR family transcriptional regulator n=1 Tax=Streptomyces sp. SAS_272 TaxID=3412747 RepID=UPI00403CFEE2